MTAAPGVDLPATSRSATAAVGAILRTAAETFPPLGPDVGRIDRRTLGERIVRFEALRASLPVPQRVDAAAFLVSAAARHLVYAGAGGLETPLVEYMTEPARPLALSQLRLGAVTGLVPRIPYAGEPHEGSLIARLAGALASRHEVSAPARDALTWIATQRVVDLSGEKFVVLGAAAEIAPTDLLLAAGATVLFIDVQDARVYVAERRLATGVLVFSESGADLLRNPREIAATIGEFAAGVPVHVAAFAYRGGENREWRLAAAMNAIVRALDPALLKSIAMAVSPTSPAQASAEDAAEALARFARPSLADRFWRGIGVQKPNLHTLGGTHWPRSVVSMQGSSYLAAQYFEKRLAAEVYALRGVGSARPVVSANVAGISHTRSMDIPLFTAGFLGAAALGVATYEPETTRALAGLIYLENLLNPASASRVRDPAIPENDRATRVHATQVHGGLYAYPYAIEGTMTRAALIGLAKKPSLVPRVLASLARR